MGEEQKKPEEKKMEEKKAEQTKKPEEKTEKKEEKPAEEEKKKEEAPPPPPPEIVLKVYMHCEGCAKKVRRSLYGFDGVEDVITDCKSHKVVVKGEKADPVKVLERVQRKSHRKVELLSPIPKPPPAEAEKPKEEEKPKPEEKKEEPKVITVVLKVFMHCEACAQGIKKRIQRMKGVESAEPDLKSSQVTVKGTFETAKLVDYLHKRTGKRAVIVKQEPTAEKKKETEEGKAKEEEKKDGGGGGGEEKKDDGKGKETENAEEGKVMEMKRSEFYHYPAMEMYAYPPQIFSDENPNACSVM